MIRFTDVSYSYRVAGRDVPAVSGVSLHVEPGEMLAVLGANGSGKSTLVQLANGLLRPGEGSVQVDGIDTADDSRARSLREHVALVFQHPDDQIVGTTVEDDTAFGPENLGLPREEIRTRVDEALDAVGLTGLERREPHLLSGGQKQRLAIAGALAMRPAYLVLDEPTSMLDPVGRRDVARILEELASEGRGIIHVTHDLSVVARADRVVVLNHGSVVFSGELGGLVADSALLDACGLELPPLAVLVGEIRGRGVDIDVGVSGAEALVDALWR